MLHLNTISLEFDALDSLNSEKVPKNMESMAAVLIAIALEEGNPKIVFTRRADHMNSHAGQVSYPGGHWERGDENLAATALRESFEEIGLEILNARALDLYEADGAKVERVASPINRRSIRCDYSSRKSMATPS